MISVADIFGKFEGNILAQALLLFLIIFLDLLSSFFSVDNSVIGQ